MPEIIRSTLVELAMVARSVTQTVTGPRTGRLANQVAAAALRKLSPELMAREIVVEGLVYAPEDARFRLHYQPQRDETAYPLGGGTLHIVVLVAQTAIVDAAVEDAHDPAQGVLIWQPLVGLVRPAFLAGGESEVFDVSGSHIVYRRLPPERPPDPTPRALRRIDDLSERVCEILAMQARGI